MAKKADKTLKKNGVYLSQYEANEKWEDKNPRKMIGFRVTPEEKERIDKYIEKKKNEENQKIAEMPLDEQKKYRRKYSTEKGRASVNALLKYLLEEEMQTNLDD